MKERTVFKQLLKTESSTVRLRREVILSLVVCPMSRLVCFGNLIYRVTSTLSNQDYNLLNIMDVSSVILRYLNILTTLLFSTEYGNCALLPLVCIE